MKRSEQRMPREQLLGILYTPAREPWRAEKAAPVVHLGYCRYCGQQLSLAAGEGMAQEVADAAATADCHCALARAGRKIEERFGGGARYPMGEDTVEFLKACVVALYASNVDQVNVKINDTVQGKLGFSAKGSISIKRKDSVETADEV